VIALGALAAAVVVAASPAAAERQGACVAVARGDRGAIVCIGAPPNMARVVLRSRNGSAQRGLAVITFGLHQTKVVIRLRGAPQGVGQPAYLYEGSCRGAGKAVAFLGLVRNGRRVALADPVPHVSGYSVKIRESTAAGARVIACGEVLHGH
jgi:hypothetical protein